jgi:hypothetical protein
MRLNLNKIDKILEEQKRLSSEHRGDSALTVYGCFSDLLKDNKKVDRTEVYCEKCRCWEHCKSYLSAVEIRINPFDKDRTIRLG